MVSAHPLQPSTAHLLLPPAKVANTREVPSPPEDYDEMGDSQVSHSSAEAAQTLHSLLQRINALEVYVTAQDQRIVQLEAEIEKISGPHQSYADVDPFIKDIHA